MQAIDLKGTFPQFGVTSIVAPCAAKKSKLPTDQLRVTSITAGLQLDVAQSWRQSLSAAHPVAAAESLYLGPSLQRVLRASRTMGVPAWIISAGLGLISSSKIVPAYDLTLSKASPASVAGRIQGSFSPSAWWDQVQTGPYASDLDDIAGKNSTGRVLICLTKPYAQMIGPALAALPAPMIKRLRIFGPGLAAHLPEPLRAQVMAYDQRLDLISPGIKLDAGARALEHFCSLVKHQPMLDSSGDQDLIRHALKPINLPAPASRVRMDDAELRAHIAPWAAEGLSAQRALRRLRDHSQVSCEQRRFQRLYDEVRQ